MSSSFDRENSNNLPENVSASESARTPSLYGSGLLRKVLQHTTELGNADEPLSRREVEALRGVVNRHRGQPLAVEPVARELVDAMLVSLLPSAGNGAETRRAVAGQVAQTLLDDQTGSARLAAIWKRLCEEEA